MKFIVYLSKSNPLGIILDFVNVAVGYNFPFHIPNESLYTWCNSPSYKALNFNLLFIILGLKASR